ncbi:MAG: HD domain-containing protein [Candidatus Diapherotrites archaeon]
MDKGIVTISEIIHNAQSYDSEINEDQIRKAFDFAMMLGEQRIMLSFIKPHKEHLLDIAKTVTDLKLDSETICAAILHEAVIADVSVEKLEELFGKIITTIVKEYSDTYLVLESNKSHLPDDKLATIMLAISKDVRSVFVSIFIALDTLRFIDYYPKNKRKEIAKSIQAIYLPICHKLGLIDIEWEIQDRCFKILEPDAYAEIKSKVSEKREARELKIEEAVADVESLIGKRGNYNLVVYGRAKSFHSTYLKMMNTGKTLTEVNDFLGLRILCKDESECYNILGVIHSNYIYLPEYFDDYISRPKKNHYQSIHTTVIWKNQPLEIQIRTEKMHNEAEGGIAAHWKYKKYSKNLHFDKKLSWARQLVERQRKIKNLASVFQSIEMQLGKCEIFVLTPKKEVIVLPEKSTPIDFAFTIHTNLGSKCKQARVNGRLVPLDYQLSNGDTVVIDTSNKTQTNRGWLGFVKSEKAKKKIRSALSMILKPKKHKIDTHINDDKIVIAECCNPLPGDDCIVYKTTKRKLMIHRKDCDNVEKISKEKICKTEKGFKNILPLKYTTNMKVKATDRAGLLTDLLNVFDDAKLEVINTEAKSKPDGTITCIFKINVKNTEQAEGILTKLKCVDFVHNVERN